MQQDREVHHQKLEQTHIFDRLLSRQQARHHAVELVQEIGRSRI